MKAWFEKENTGAVIRVVTIFALLALAIFWSWMNRIDRVLTLRGGGIIIFQLAYTLERAQEIIAGWGPDGVAAAIRGIRIDFAFIPSYVVFFTGFTVMLMRPHKGFIRTLGLVLMFFPIIAGVLDGIENFRHLAIFAAPETMTAEMVRTSSIISMVKFGLLIIDSLYWPLAAVFLAFQPDIWTRGIDDGPIDDA